MSIDALPHPPAPESAASRGAVRSVRSLLQVSLCAALWACAGPGAGSRGSPGAVEAPAWSYLPDVRVSHPPFEEVHVEWKHRLDQPYVFLEQRGSYLGTGALLPRLQRAMLDQGLRPSGPPFALFYDDPGRVPIDELRSRACIPVDRELVPGSPLAFDVLPSTTVVYALVSGAYPEVPRAYPALFAYMARLRWIDDGPIRETYLVEPGAVRDWSELRCEIQIPVRHAER